MDKRGLRWLWLTLAVVLADRATKAIFEAYTPENYRHELVHNFIYLVHSRNPGIAFGLFAGTASPWVRVALVGASVAVIAVLSWLLLAGHAHGWMSRAGLALIIGGAAGNNLVDRLLHGGVTDFFEVLIGSYHWPAFNLADSAITVGAVLLILELLFGAGQATDNSSKRRTG
ncbi:MAG: signal peptidase II [Candidatus Acidiferrales bacterium]|jgi:signal peptidase II